MPGVVARMPENFTTMWTAAFDDYVVGATPVGAGERCVVALGSGDVVMLEAVNGREQWRTKAHVQGLNVFAASPDSTRLATGGQDGTARIFSADGARLVELPGRGGWVESLAWSPTGDRLATASGKVVRVWTADGVPVVETEPSESTVTGLAWSPDGQQLATIAYGGVRLWPVASNGSARHLPWKGSLVSIAWSPDGKVIACGSQDCSVHFWRVASGKDSEMSGYPSKPRALVWAGDSSYLATSGAPVVCVWGFLGKGPEGSKPQMLQAHAGTVTALAQAKSGSLLASGSQAGEAVLWRPGKGRKPFRRTAIDGEITSLAFTRTDEALLAGTSSGHVTSWALD